jgi:2-polyprenyl-3-methyl-5-hydroxy-6-metoxy-1,4-benzoquinol methylase
MFFNNRTDEMGVFQKLMALSKDSFGLGETPPEIQGNLAKGMQVVEGLASVIGDRTHGPYFEASKIRYAHYFAAAKAFVPEVASVLDIGNAPGHVGIGLHLMGYQVKGVNLNAEWRSTYPGEEWLQTFDVLEHDIERSPLPFQENSYDAAFFTEILEHVAIRDPKDILADILRVLKPGGVLIFSTPNVCNLSNIYALLNGHNIFWAPEIFYGSLDRHNREYTPGEVQEVMKLAGLQQVALWGLNDSSNWRAGGAEFAWKFVEKFGTDHMLTRNTIAAIYKKPEV